MAFGLWLLGRTQDDPILFDLGAAFLSLAFPRRIVWIVLAAWGFFFLEWSLYELILWIQGDPKFGPMAMPYGIAALAMLLAAKSSFRGRRNILPGPPPKVAAEP